MIDSLSSLCKKIKQCHRDRGFKVLLEKMRAGSLLLIKTWVNKNILKITHVKDALNQAYPSAMPIAALKVERKTPRFNIVLDHLGQEDFFGGVGTALIAASLFAGKQDMPLRVISRSKESKPDQFFKFLNLQKIPVPKKVEFFSDYDRGISRKRARLETSDQDIYMATSWWTAEAIESVNFRPSYFHLIQDTPSDPRHIRALSDPKARLISNQKTLGAAFFKPAFSLHTPIPDAFKAKQKYKLLFYARPSKPQNHFYIGLKLLDDALTQGILDSKEWDIYFAGETTSPLIFSVGIKPKILGKLDFADYLALIKTIDLGISFSDPSHPNYVAMDVASSGGVALTNAMENQSSNIIKAPLENLLDGLKEAVQLAKDPAKRMQNYKSNQIETCWEEAFKETLQYMDENK